MKKLLCLVILILALIVLSGCSQQSITGNIINDYHDVESTGEIKEFEIIAKNWEFVPNTIEVNLGDKVELHIESVDVAHGFRLPDFGINEKLEPHNDIHVDFIADKKGTFPFSCSVPCGSGHGGMQGQLIVR